MKQPERRGSDTPSCGMCILLKDNTRFLSAEELQEYAQASRNCMDDLMSRRDSLPDRGTYPDQKSGEGGVRG